MKNKIEHLRSKISLSNRLENKKINDVLKWLNKKDKINKMKVEKVSVNKMKDWFYKKNGNLVHKSGQFFSVEGVKVKSAKEREISDWEQPILNQKHGGILAILMRERNKIIEFLLFARKEPGDNKIKLCPSFSATQSNINLAHGGKKTPLYEIILAKKKKIIGETIHYEEGARFWKKSNWNVIVNLNNPYDKRIKGGNYMWASLKQIKKLALKNRYVNPFVKTILFIL